MKNKKRFAALMLALLMGLALLCACGSTKDVDVDVEVGDIAAAVDAALGKDGSFAELDDRYIKGYMHIDTAEYEGFSFIARASNSGTTIDEYGVFRCKDSAQTKEIKSAVEGYLQLRVDSWMDEYMPEEKPKVTSAEVKTNGNYVMYCILGDADKSAAFDAFDGALK